MPQAKPTQVIVHRIELQQSERSMLKEYVEVQQQQQWIKLGASVVQPVVIATGVMGAAYVGIRGYQALMAALNAFDPQAALDELLEPIKAAPIVGSDGPIFGTGGIFDFIEEVLDPERSAFDSVRDSGPVTDSEGNPVTAEELQARSKEMREEMGLLNSIVAPFGITPFPKWL